EEVMWAVSTRCDPDSDIDIIRRMWSGPLDPIVRPGAKGFSSRAILDATRPWEWRGEFPPVVQFSAQRLTGAPARWGARLGPPAAGARLAPARWSRRPASRGEALDRLRPRAPARRRPARCSGAPRRSGPAARKACTGDRPASEPPRAGPRRAAPAGMPSPRC